MLRLILPEQYSLWSPRVLGLRKIQENETRIGEIRRGQMLGVLIEASVLDGIACYLSVSLAIC